MSRKPDKQRNWSFNMGWMDEGKEAEEMDDMINSILFFFFCVEVIGGSILVLLLCAPYIKTAFRVAQGFIF
jgi:hypothetical protein